MPEKSTENQTGLYEGDRIMIDGCYGQRFVLEIENFMDCLGVFVSKQERLAGKFTPLCDMYGYGAGSSIGYISNYGEYVKNPVALWMQVSKSTPLVS